MRARSGGGGNCSSGNGTLPCAGAAWTASCVRCSSCRSCWQLLDAAISPGIRQEACTRLPTGSRSRQAAAPKSTRRPNTSYVRRRQITDQHPDVPGAHAVGCSISASHVSRHVSALHRMLELKRCIVEPTHWKSWLLNVTARRRGGKRVVQLFRWWLLTQFAGVFQCGHSVPRRFRTMDTGRETEIAFRKSLPLIIRSGWRQGASMAVIILLTFSPSWMSANYQCRRIAGLVGCRRP